MSSPDLSVTDGALPIWQAQLALPLAEAERLADALADAPDADGWAVTVSAPRAEGADGGLDDRALGGSPQVLLTIHAAGHDLAGVLGAAIARCAAAHHIAAPDPDIAPLAETDWQALADEAAPPVFEAGFFIHRVDRAGTGRAGTGRAGPGQARDAIPIPLVSTRGFGTGRHGSTAGCLAALRWLAARARPDRVLDLGTGSGVLAIAARHFWTPPPQIIAADIDPEAVEAARANIAASGMAADIPCVQSDGLDAPDITAAAPFTLIVANILAGPLMVLAAPITRHLAPGGWVVLSGLLDSQAADVMAAYRAEGLRQAHAIARGEWATLILARDG